MRITRRPRAALATLAPLAAAACFSEAPVESDDDASPTATVEASATANVFSPSRVTIQRGGSVTWTFAARPHNVAFSGAAGAPADVPVTTNGQVTRQFASAGSFPYACTLHAGMTGTVVVVDD